MIRSPRHHRPFLMLVSVVGALLMGATGARGSGPFTEAWASRYNGPGSGTEEGVAIAVDGEGNIVMIGYSPGSGTDTDYATVKYDGATGATLWTARYDGPASGPDQANSIAVDATGNVFVTGLSLGPATDFDYATVKYDGATGSQLWVTRYNGPGVFADFGSKVVVGPDGNVVVTGSSLVGPGNSAADYATIKYNSATGAPIWTSRYNGPAGNNDRASDLAIDTAGDVVVTGFSLSSAAYDYATVKYNGTSGAQLWASRYNGPGSDYDYAHAVAVDSSGNVVVTGTSSSAGEANYDYATVKYNGASGAQFWASRFGGSLHDAGRDVSVDSVGNIFVTGTSTDPTTGPDYATLKYDGATGAALWTARYNHLGAGADSASALALDADGDVVVTGSSNGGGVTGPDYATLKYNGATGATHWTVRYNGPGSLTDGANAVAVDTAGSIFITGYSSGGGATGLDYATIKYSEPPSADNLTTSCLVTRGGLRRSLATGRYSQVVTVKNISATTITGPVSLVLDSLSPTATLFNKTGDTVYTSPTGSPYRNSAGSLAPGASAAITLEFTNPTNVGIAWTGRILAGPGAR